MGPGRVTISLEDGTTKTINVTRAHLEEDAGKSVHDVFDGMTGVDLNRAGTPLLEIVSEPELRSAKEAVAYLKVIHSIIRYLDISDGNMAEGFHALRLQRLNPTQRVLTRSVRAQKLKT